MFKTGVEMCGDHNGQGSADSDSSARRLRHHRKPGPGPCGTAQRRDESAPEVGISRGEDQRRRISGGCLHRELNEELGIAVSVQEALAPATHRYPTFTVTLHPFRCALESGLSRCTNTQPSCGCNRRSCSAWTGRWRRADHRGVSGGVAKVRARRGPAAVLPVSTITAHRGTAEGLLGPFDIPELPAFVIDGTGGIVRGTKCSAGAGV